MSINRAIISGNLTRDPELRTTASGMPVLGFGVAVNDRRKNQQSGEWEDYPNFVDCTMFGNRAQSISQYLHKGSKVSIEGKLRWSQWEKEGQKRSKLEVIIDEIEFMSQPNAAQAPQMQQPQPTYQQAQPVRQTQPRQGYAPQQQYQQHRAPQPAAVSVYDEDIPF